MGQKIADDYKAKIRLWARNPRVVRIPAVPVLPYFGCVKFNSYAAMNAWKKEYLKKIARQGGCKWKKI